MKALIAIFIALVCAVPVARASITYSGTQNITIPTDFDGVYLDFTDSSDATAVTTSTSFPTSWDVNFFFGGAAVGSSDTFSIVTDSATVNSTVHNLALASTVDMNSTTYDGFSGSTDHIGTGGLPEFANNTQGYIGFILNPGVDDYAGWMRVTLRDDGNIGTIHDWAWETTNDGSIEVGAIPEPSTVLPVSAILLAGLVCHRRRGRRGADA